MEHSPRVRIADIAQELGLSTATVSNVIHGKTKKMSEETVKRVQKLLEERQYIPSMAGILLAQNDSRIIGVVVHDHEKYEEHTLEDSFIAASLNTLAKELDREGYFLMLKLTKSCEEIPRFSSMWNMVGLILMGFCREDYKKLKEQMHIPLVVYDAFCEEEGNFFNIETDHYAGGVLMARHLKEKGHQKVLCIADNDVCMDLMRFEGMRSVIPKAELMIIPYETKKRHSYYEEHLARIMEYTAVFAVSDYYAIDFMQFLFRQGIRVPEQISVAGFDDIKEASYMCPGLTTIRQDYEERAKMALRMLCRQKEGDKFPKNVRLPVSLVERESVGNLDNVHKNGTESL